MEREAGITLVELLVVVAVIGILVGLVHPAFSDVIARSKARGEVNGILSVLSLARSESVKRSHVVTLCGSDGGAGCNGNWSAGWLLFVDEDADGRHDGGEEVLKVGRAGEGYQLSYRAFGSSVHLRFTPLGFTLAHNGTFKLCPPDNDPRYARAVIISKTARTRLSGDKDGDGVHEGASGQPLVCP